MALNFNQSQLSLPIQESLLILGVLYGKENVPPPELKRWTNESKLIDNLQLIWEKNSDNLDIVKKLLWLISTIVDSDWLQLHHELVFKDTLLERITESLESANINQKREATYLVLNLISNCSDVTLCQWFILELNLL